MRLPGLSLFLFLAVPAMAAVDLPGNEVAYSQSGQFVVSGQPLAPAAARVFRYDANFRRFVGTGWNKEGGGTGQALSSTNPTTLLLDPNYLVASAERLRTGFQELLQLKEPYRGRIYINLLGGASPEDEITFNQIFDKPKQTWSVRITMPAELAPERILRVLIQALLFEASHRGAGPGGCEIPTWLSDGLIAHLSERLGVVAVFEHSQTLNVVYRPMNEAWSLNEEIGPGGCLTLEQLSWPGTLAAQPGLARTFALSSHAFVLELLQLPNGGRCLGQTIRLLPRYENWQFAFLNGFQAHFPSLLDAEKWWAVNSLLVGGRGSFEKWTVAESLQRLDVALRLPIERRVTPGSEATREEVSVQTIVSTMTFEQQQSMLARVISGLFTLELRAAPHVVRLIEDYRTTLEKYVADRDEARRKDAERYRPGRREEVVVEVFLRRLDSLAQLRQDFELLMPADGPPVEPATAVISSARP